MGLCSILLDAKRVIQKWTNSAVVPVSSEKVFVSPPVYEVSVAALSAVVLVAGFAWPGLAWLALALPGLKSVVVLFVIVNRLDRSEY